MNSFNAIPHAYVAVSANDLLSKMSSLLCLRRFSGVVFMVALS